MKHTYTQGSILAYEKMHKKQLNKIIVGINQQTEMSYQELKFSTSASFNINLLNSFEERYTYTKKQRQNIIFLFKCCQFIQLETLLSKFKQVLTRIASLNLGRSIIISFN